MKVLIPIVIGLLVLECGKGTTSNPPKATPNKLIDNPIVKEAIREELEKPEGELTKTDLEKVTELSLKNNHDLTKAQIAELQKALPECKIFSNAK